MSDLSQAHDLARAIGERVLGHDPGPVAAVESQSSQVFVGSDIVVKLAEHSRLDREVRLAASVPSGLTPTLLGSGIQTFEERQVQFACYRRAAGVALGMGLPGVDANTARSLAAQAVQRLDLLHDWRPPDDVAQILRQPLNHGGFASQGGLLSLIERLVATDRDQIVDRVLIDGLFTVAEGAPLEARTDVPVHADCYWDNWLASDGELTALLDFEWARFGDPRDDYFFLISFSGEHLTTVLDVVAHESGISSEALRKECEVRQANFVVSDILLALTVDECDLPHQLLARRLASLEQLIVGQRWHQT